MQQDRSAEILATLQRIQELTAQSVQMQIRQLENQEAIMQKTELQYASAQQFTARAEAFQHAAQARAKKATNLMYVLITFLAMLFIIKLFA